MKYSMVTIIDNIALYDYSYTWREKERTQKSHVLLKCVTHISLYLGLKATRKTFTVFPKGSVS